MISLRCLLVGFLILWVAACGGGGSSAPPAGPPPQAATADVSVTVVDTLGRFVDGAAVRVVSSGVSATTGTTGKVILKVPVGGEEVLKIDKSGFAEQVRVIRLDAAATRGLVDVLLVAREPAQTIAGIENGGSASGKHGVKVTFPANALVNANGQAVTGTVELAMTPLDVSLSDVGAFPGLFEGIPTGGTRGAIVSLGTSELVPQQNGQKLQLANGKSATIELPMYASQSFDATALKAGDSVPLWSLNTATGVWQQEGQGTVIAQPSAPTGLALRATVTHFSWWNVDQFANRATANITVTAPGNTIPANTLAALEAQIIAGAGPNWLATRSVTVGTASSLAVPAASTVAFTAAFDAGNLRCRGSAQASFTPGGTTNVTVPANCFQVPEPVIVAPAAVSVTNSAAPTRVQVVINGSVPDTVQLLVDGAVVATLGSQLFYVFLLDTAALPEGTASVRARASLNGVTRDSNAVQVVIDRTGPREIAITPAPGTLLSGHPPIAVTFSEPISSANLAQTVVLSVTPVGQSTPVVLPATLALDAATNTILTVTPGADLPLGVVSLGWASVKDGAGNLVTGTVAATFGVDRSVLVGPELAHQQFLGGGDNVAAGLVFRADNSLLAAHRPNPGDTWVLSRFDAGANTWVPVVAAVNERPARQMMALAVDGQDVPYIAYTQKQAADPAQLELVLKRLNGTTIEAAAPVVALTGQRPGDIGQGSMAIDAQNRPVIALTDATDSTVRLFRLEQGNLVPHATITTLAADPHVVVQPNGVLLVAYLQGIAGSNAAILRVKSVTNGVVAQLGADIDSVPNATQSIGSPRLVMVGSDPWLLWIKNGFANAARFDGANWVAQAFPAPLQMGFTFEAGVLNGDLVVVGGNEAAIQVLRLHNGAWETGFDATGRADHQDKVTLATRGTNAAMISSSIFRPAADVQRLLFP